MGQYPVAVHCPSCQADDTKVVDSRLAEEGGAVRRRRQCLTCAYRFTTFERVEEVPLVVVKSDGSTQPFDRVRSPPACAPRARVGRSRRSRSSSSQWPIEDGCGCQGARSARAVSGSPCSTACALLDEVAYLRFASVYKNFDAASDFQSELELLSKLGARPV